LTFPANRKTVCIAIPLRGPQIRFRLRSLSFFPAQTIFATIENSHFSFLLRKIQVENQKRAISIKLMIDLMQFAFGFDNKVYFSLIVLIDKQFGK
jgi:hypothetical protein